MYNRDTGDSYSRTLANLPPFTSRANLSGCSAVLIAPNAILSAAHCTNYASTGTVTATWNGQTRSGSVFTRIGEDHLLVITGTPFTGTLGKMTAPYSGSSENGRLVWKVGSGGNGVLGFGSSGPFYDGIFRAMTNRIEVNNVASPPNPVTSDWLFYDYDGPPSKPQSVSRPTTWYEGGTAPGDSGGPLYMFENGRWFVIGVTSGPDAGYYRDGRVRTDMGQIESLTGYTWARPVAPQLEMRWVAQDLAASLANGAAVASWPRNGGADAWTNSSGDGAVGTATLALNATPAGTAAVDFPGTARLALPAASNPVGGETSFTVAMVVRADAAGAGAESNWFDNTGLIDGEESGSVNDWGLALASTGKPGFGVGNADTTQYGSTSIQDGQWHVVVATWDGSEVTGDAAGSDRNMTVYVNSIANVARRQGPEFLSVARNAATLTLGGSRASSRFLDGGIAELRLYRGALDDTAVDSLIRELKNAHIGPQLDFTLTQPATGRAAVPFGQGLILDGNTIGASAVSITQTSGPAPATFSSTTSLPSAVTFPNAGTYQLQITASQGGSSVVRQVLVEVLASPGGVPGNSSVAVGGSWTALNIGDASTAGSLTAGATTATLTGSGMGFQEVSDSMRFVWKPLTGNGSITGRVTGFTANNGGSAFGGLMLRSSLRRESSNVAATVISGGGVRFTQRVEDAAYTEPLFHTLRAPYWVRVERIGNVFTGYRSEDGVNWVQHGTPVSIADIPSSAVWGLAVTSHGGTVASEAKFSDVLLEPLGGQAGPSNSWAGANIGSPSVAGSHSGSGSAFTVNGGGADIFGTSDQFYFLSQNYSGDARLTARVTSQDRTDPWAKAGVMVRASSAADAANAFMAVSPLNGMPWQTRAANAGSTATTTTGTAGFTAPYWLRLTRAGDTFTCHRSTDGVTWFQLGAPAVIENAPVTMHAGMLIASMNNNGNSVVTFDNLSLMETGTPLAPTLAFAAGQNPSVANNFTLTASADVPVTWSWQKIAGPGELIFGTQNSATPQTAFTQAGNYTIRASATASGVTTFIDRSLDLSLSARWDFNTDGQAEGWAPFNSTTSVAGGLVTGSVTATDPQFSKNNATFISGDLVKNVIVRYRSTATGTPQLFWGRVGATGFTGSRSVNASYPTANSWTVLSFNLAAHAEWAGNVITNLRFDPTGGTGSTYDIDWIALSDGAGGVVLDADGDGYDDLLETVRYWNASPLSKTWQTGTSDWNTGPLGAGAQSAWNPGDDAVFDRPDTYTVTLASSLVPGRVNFRGGQVTLAGSGSITASSVSVEASAILSAAGDRLFRPGNTAFTLDGVFTSGAATTSADRVVTLTGAGELAGGALRVAGGNFPGLISGGASFIKEGTGTLLLTGNNTFTGASVINAGIVQVGSGGTAGALGAASITSAGTLVFNRSDALTWPGSLSGSGNLVKSGANTLTLTGALTHAGGTSIEGGMLQVGDGGTAGSLNGGPVSNSGTIRFNRSDLSSCDATITGGTFSKLGAGTLVLSGNNTFGSGTLTFGTGSLNAGYIRLAHPKALGNYSKIYLASATSGVSGIEVSGGHAFNYAIDTVGRNTNAGNTMLRNVSGSNTWQGNITITSGGGSYDIESLAGELTVTGTIGVGNISIGIRALNVKGAANVTFAGPVTDITATPIAITKTGAGVLRMNAVNTATGAINVTGGGLLVNGSVTPAITVGVATLGGGGTISGAALTGTSAANRSVLAPGDAAVGTLNALGTVTLGPDSAYRWEIANLNPAAAAFDKLAAANIAITATSANPLVIVVLPTQTLAPSAQAVFPIATASGSLTGFSAAAVQVDASAFPPELGSWSVRETGETLELVFTPGGYDSWIAGFPGISDPSEDADPDGDGWTNRDEWVAGTDPTSGTSRFTSTVTTGGFTFNRIPGRTYVVETSQNLGSWSVHATVPDGSGEITVPHPVPPGALRFYRVLIQLNDP